MNNPKENQNYFKEDSFFFHLTQQNGNIFTVLLLLLVYMQ